MIIRTGLETTVIFDRKRVLQTFKKLLGDVVFDRDEYRKALWVEFARYVDHLARKWTKDVRPIENLDEFFINIAWEVIPAIDYLHHQPTEALVREEFDLLVDFTKSDLLEAFEDVANTDMMFLGVEPQWTGFTFHIKPYLIFKKQEQPPNTMFKQLLLF